MMSKSNEKLRLALLFAATIIAGNLIGYYGRMLVTKDSQLQSAVVSKAEPGDENAGSIGIGVLEAYLGAVEKTNLFAHFETAAVEFDNDLRKRADQIFKRAYTPYSCFVSVESKTHYIVASKEAIEANPNIVADFYCDGDNDQVEIQSAFMNLADSNERRVVELTAGTFVLNDQIVLNSNVIFKGAGRDATILKLQDEANPFRQAGMVRGFQIQDFDLTDMTWDGNRAGQTSQLYAYTYGRFGFYCEVCLNMKIERLRVTKFYGYGLDPHGEPETAVYSDGLIIDDVISIDNAWDGMTIDKTLNTVIRNSVCQDNGRHGINLVTGTKDTLIENNQILNNGWDSTGYFEKPLGNGITIQDNEGYGTGRTIANNNNIVASASRGVRVDTNCQGDYVHNNRIEGAGDCIYILSSIDTVIDNNDCVGNKKINVAGTINNLLITNSGRIGLPDGTTVTGSYPEPTAVA